MRDNVIVVWSGGADSTRLLHEWSLKGSAANPVHAISITHNCIGYDGQADRERESRAKIKDYLISIGRNIKFHEIEVRVPECIHNIGSTMGFGVHQANIWLGNIMPYLGDDNNKIVFGYIQGDDFFHYRHHVTNIIQQLSYISGSSAKVEYPLEWESKEDVLRYLYRNNLIDMVWWCEFPEGNKPCGNCSSCHRHDQALYILRNKYKLFDDDNNYIE